MFGYYQDILNKLFWISDCVLEFSHSGLHHSNFDGQEIEEMSYLLRLAGKALCNEGFEEWENMFVNNFTGRIIAQRKPTISDVALAIRLGTDGEWDFMLERDSLQLDVDKEIQLISRSGLESFVTSMMTSAGLGEGQSYLMMDTASA